MKKTNHSLFLLPLILITTSACQKQVEVEISPFRITYSRYASEDNFQLTELNYNGLFRKMNIDENGTGENFILAIYQHDEGDIPCGCWIDFKATLQNFIKETGYEVYSIRTSEFVGEKDLGFKIPSNTSLCLIKNGEIYQQFRYSLNDKMFSSTSALKDKLSQYLLKPNLIKINEANLDNLIFDTKEDLNIEYIWESCDDCKFASSHHLFPFVEQELEKTMYVIDIDDLTYYQGVKNTSNERYISFLEKHHISEKGDDIFGYSAHGPVEKGFVPCFQRWENGSLIDMSVVYNDKVDFFDDKFIIGQSYYSDDRTPYLKHATNVEINVLRGLEISKEDLTSSGNWDRQKSIKYHGPLLESFLNYYLK